MSLELSIYTVTENENIKNKFNNMNNYLDNSLTIEDENIYFEYNINNRGVNREYIIFNNLYLPFIPIQLSSFNKWKGFNDESFIWKWEEDCLKLYDNSSWDNDLVLLEEFKPNSPLFTGLQNYVEDFEEIYENNNSGEFEIYFKNGNVINYFFKELVNKRIDFLEINFN